MSSQSEGKRRERRRRSGSTSQIRVSRRGIGVVTVEQEKSVKLEKESWRKKVGGRGVRMIKSGRDHEVGASTRENCGLQFT